jgi:hypothetical protein
VVVLQDSSFDGGTAPGWLRGSDQLNDPVVTGGAWLG